MRWLLILLLIFTSNSYAQSEGEIEQLIIERAIVHGADPATLLRVARCESRFNPYLVGASGERGVAQWHPRGVWFSTPAYRELGINIIQLYTTGHEHVVYYDIDMFAWAFANGYQRHWSCY